VGEDSARRRLATLQAFGNTSSQGRQLQPARKARNDDDLNVAGELSGRVAANLDIAGDLILDTRGLWLRRCRAANRNVARELIVHCFTTFSTTFQSYFWSQTSGAE